MHFLPLHTPCDNFRTNPFALSLLLLLTILFLPLTSLAQITGTVQSVGFDGNYRGNCWTPMLLSLHNSSAQAQQLQIRIRQHDLDRDIVTYTRNITLSGAQSADQRFWMYFIPQPTDGGLAAPASGGTLAQLQKQLRVQLFDTDGKLVAQFPVNRAMTDVNRLSPNRGTRLILLVQTSASRPSWQQYNQASGLLEDVIMVPIRPDDLPEDVIGYQAVDAVVWLNAPPPDPRLPSQQQRFTALRDYVRQGGRLVISQGPQWRATVETFGSMLPVEIADMAERHTLEPLQSLAHSGAAKPPIIMAAKALAKPNSVVDLWMKWPAPPSATRSSSRPASTQQAQAPREISTPCIARCAVGLGSVTWVAFNLGDRSLTSAIPTGWPHIWDRVFGWHNASLSPNDPAAKTAFAGQPNIVNLTSSLFSGIDLPGRSGGYIVIAILFFCLYWAAAGPLNYLVLASKKRIGLSWPVFALATLGATLLTVIIVQLLVRGAPRARHVTLVRFTPGHPALITSQIGLYIPHDGNQTIELPAGADGRIATLTPLPALPGELPDNAGFITPMEYDLPVPLNADAPAHLTVPYRSTLKKMRACWIGDLSNSATIDGQAELVGAYPYLSGLLTNHLGRDLSDVYFAFAVPHATGRSEDRIVYLPRWPKDTSVDLWSILTDRQNRAVFVGRIVSKVQSPPGMTRRLNDALYYDSDPTRGWAGYWYDQFSGSGFGVMNFSPRDDAQSFAMLCLFNLLPPMPSVDDHARVDLQRRGARFMDASAAVTAGQLLIFARDDNANGPLPFPLTVKTLFGHAPVVAQGTTYYQITLPLQHAAPHP